MISIPNEVDLLIIGGGINGAGIARDAAGRGLKVLLCEQHDLAQHTSSASSKLVHGGLRYLEHYEFRLVRESLGEREVLLRAAPHIVHPMRFVMPHVPQLRPAWMIRIGLFLYDYLARRDRLPKSQVIDLRTPSYNSGLQSRLRKGFVYADCWVDDARLVLANARAAAQLGATILTRTACVAGERDGTHWRVTLQPENAPPVDIGARALINAAGPWRKEIFNKINYLQKFDFKLRLVKGSHIIVPRLYEGDHAFILQNDDRRVIFVYPYEEHYTLIGTTDVAHEGEPGECTASAEEIEYLCRAVNRYFARTLTPANVVWHYCGIRPLFDDGQKNVSHITRDYTLRVDGDANEAPLLSVFGGKITTYRKLAEHALEKLQPWLPRMNAPWTHSALLPGGALRGKSLPAYVQQLAGDHPQLSQPLLHALAARHGAAARAVLGDAQTPADLGKHFGHTLYAREVDYFMTHEWARSAADILWRRTKCGLHVNVSQKQMLEQCVTMRVSAAMRK
ncbi:MAG: glycerol-3-phosphate dehydrogenase [Betaproteobacteria bacterium]|nr:glycerol-3-phosphate dehydrogenase [Betaproteobacteria bacterium]